MSKWLPLAIVLICLAEIVLIASLPVINLFSFILLLLYLGVGGWYSMELFFGNGGWRNR